MIKTHPCVHSLLGQSGQKWSKKIKVVKTGPKWWFSSKNWTKLVKQAKIVWNGPNRSKWPIMVPIGRFRLKWWKMLKNRKISVRIGRNGPKCPENFKWMQDKKKSMPTKFVKIWSNRSRATDPYLFDQRSYWMWKEPKVLESTFHPFVPLADSF